MIDKNQKSEIFRLAKNHSLETENEALRLASFSAAVTLLTFPHLTGLWEGIEGYRQYDACLSAAALMPLLFGFTPSEKENSELLLELDSFLTIASEPHQLN